jgi:hypothetical protein
MSPPVRAPIRQHLTPLFALNMNFKSSQHFASPQTGDAQGSAIEILHKPFSPQRKS